MSAFIFHYSLDSDLVLFGSFSFWFGKSRHYIFSMSSSLSSSPTLTNTDTKCQSFLLFSTICFCGSPSRHLPYQDNIFFFFSMCTMLNHTYTSTIKLFSICFNVVTIVVSAKIQLKCNGDGIPSKWKRARAQ